MPPLLAPTPLSAVAAAAVRCCAMKVFVRSIMFFTSDPVQPAMPCGISWNNASSTSPPAARYSCRDLLDHPLRDTLIGRALNQQSRGQLDFLTALQDMDDVAFLHGVDGQEVALMVGHQVLIAIGLRHAIAAEGIQDAPARNRIGQGAIDSIRPGERQGSVAGIEGPHGAEQDEVPTAGDTQPADRRRVCVEVRGVYLQPARRVVDVGK